MPLPLTPVKATSRCGGTSTSMPLRLAGRRLGCGADDAHASPEAAERVAGYRARGSPRRDADVAMDCVFLVRFLLERHPHLRGYCHHTCCTAAGALGAPAHSAGRRTDTKYRSGRVGPDRRLTWMKVCPPTRPPPLCGDSLQRLQGRPESLREPARKRLGFERRRDVHREPRVETSYLGSHLGEAALNRSQVYVGAVLGYDASRTDPASR